MNIHQIEATDLFLQIARIREYLISEDLSRHDELELIYYVNKLLARYHHLTEILKLDETDTI